MKKIIIILCLLLLIGCGSEDVLVINESTEAVPSGPVVQVKSCVNVSYQETEYEYVNVPTWSEINQTWYNVSTLDEVTVINKTKTECEVVGITVNGITKLYDKEFCNRCGQKLFCHDTKEGSLNRAPEFQCVCRSGEESCYSMNIDTLEKVYGVEANE